MTDFETDVERCLEILEQGGTILYPTDTVWGIGCDATNAAAVERIYAIKVRPAAKSMIILVAVEKDILQYVADPNPQIHGCARLHSYKCRLRRPVPAG